MKALLAGISIPACALALSYSSAALAQTAEPTQAGQDAAVGATAGSAGIADIVVTAQRRSESTQKAALTIQVLDGDALSGGGVTAPSQLTSVLPTVHLGTSGPATSVYVRGVGGFSATAGTNPAVPYYFDGIYVARTQSVGSEFYDVDRLELVKGPQGTLYGRNASGGALNVLTRKPKLGEFGGHAEVEVGDYGNQNGEIAVNVPLGETMAVRASGTIVDKAGYTSLGFGDDRKQAGRLKFLWQPSDDVSLLLNGSVGHVEGLGSAVVAMNNTIPGWNPWLDISDPASKAFGAATAVVPVPGFVRTTSRSDAGMDLEFYNLSAELTWDFGPATLTVLPAYRNSSMQYNGLFGFQFANGYNLGTLPTSPETSEATSLEVRLSGDTDRLKWVGGLYYFNEDQFQQYTINGGFLQTPGVRGSLGTISYAAFGQASYSLTDELRLIAGLRYTSDERSLTAGQSYVVSPAAFLGAPPPQAAACAFPFPVQAQCLVDSYSGNKTYENTSWKIGFEADVLDNSLLYATASRGFKAGGFNNQSAVGTPGQALEVRPEILTSYEAGLKSRFLDNRLQANISAFYWDYEDHQEPRVTYTAVPGITNLVFLNAGQAEIYGATLEVVARPWTGGTINSTVEYAHSEYKSFDVTIPTFSYNPASNGCAVASQNPANTVLDCSGFEVARTPEWSGNLGATQDIELPVGMLVANANMTFASGRWIGTDFIPLTRTKSYTKVDASLTYRAPSDRWSLTAFVRNITDAKVYTDGAKNPFTALVYGNIQPPRMYGARLSVEF